MLHVTMQCSIEVVNEAKINKCITVIHFLLGTGAADLDQAALLEQITSATFLVLFLYDFFFSLALFDQCLIFSQSYMVRRKVLGVC